MHNIVLQRRTIALTLCLALGNRPDDARGNKPGVFRRLNVLVDDENVRQLHSNQIFRIRSGAQHQPTAGRV